MHLWHTSGCLDPTCIRGIDKNMTVVRHFENGFQMGLECPAKGFLFYSAARGMAPRLFLHAVTRDEEKLNWSLRLLSATTPFDNLVKPVDPSQNNVFKCRKTKCIGLRSK